MNGKGSLKTRNQGGREGKKLCELEAEQNLEIKNHNLVNGEGNDGKDTKETEIKSGHTGKDLILNRRYFNMGVEETDVREKKGWVSRIQAKPHQPPEEPPDLELIQDANG
ncbi:hypothetical protein RJT34_19603 [Clitoria ternatea]|uniref:Uncharacterized protein n=1 Tax=Clitoria ternatea TaxID=43366 RepID=A0AAN9IRD5_CLITE